MLTPGPATEDASSAQGAAAPPCAICGQPTRLLDVVDFNKSCEELRGTFLPLSGEAVYYTGCPQCGFVHAPALAAWPLQRFAERIYNDQYVLVDPDYTGARPRASCEALKHLLGPGGPQLQHLDYGGGDGLLSQLLRGEGWNSRSYDPFVDRSIAPQALVRFDLVTAFEVFEHVPDPHALVDTLASLLKPDGVLLFSTLVSDGHLKAGQRITWWYAAPRNGHISLFSRQSLTRLASDHGFALGSFSDGFHAMVKTVPAWACHFLAA
ncbi:MAG: class I SAM-dependent methyltransferase [Pseudomonadota bacterium]|nr:class I SAM-dependent methyltransferase [Pseudomonadota bacterium]